MVGVLPSLVSCWLPIEEVVGVILSQGFYENTAYIIGFVIALP
ncbi:MAG TPA: hypothetical protein VLH60_03695 [Sedimentisphaerales bacterium]|nr:hypothetical protein [Sedimentisphaerales bacterium]